MAKTLFSLDLNQPQVMAVLNVTPDSFSDGGSYYNRNQQLDLGLCRQRIEQMLEQGASIIDVGGESTRPGAAVVVGVDEEMQRVLPVIELLKAYDVVISLDSSSPVVVAEAAKHGLGLINDIRALSSEGMLELAAKLQLPVCLMHMQGTPETMQDNPYYEDVCQQVKTFLQNKVQQCLAAGIKKEAILLDPGFGFGKNLAHNCQLLMQLSALAELGFPLLVGMSRKRMIGQLLGRRDVSQRVAGGLALAMQAVQRGAWIVRTHDVQETADVLKIIHRLEKGLWHE